MQSLYLFKKWLTKKTFLKQKMVDKKNLFLFQKGFFCQPFFEKIQTLGFPNKNGIFEKIQGFPKENLCRGPPFKNYGKGYQVRKLPLFTPFPRKGAGKGYQVRKLVSIPVP
jgi:hypothetical protein